MTSTRAVSALQGLQCLRCRRAHSSGLAGDGCPACRDSDTPSAYATVYDLEVARRTFRPEVLRERPSGPSRYAELLPPRDRESALTSGPTPLLALRRLGEHLGLEKLWLKDESRSPTWSFKDRPAEMAASRALAEGCRGLVASSTGNAAAATAAFASSVGLPAVVLVTQDVDPLMAAFVAGYGPLTIATATKADRWALMRRCVEHWQLYPNSNYSDPPVGNDPFAVDGYKSLAFEIWDQLGFQMPSVIAMPVGYGDGMFAMYKAFDEVASIGDNGPVPRFVVGEIYGSLGKAVNARAASVSKVDSDRETVATSIATRQSTYQAVHSIVASDGLVLAVSDDEILQSQRMLAEMEGIFAETASAAGLAALRLALAASQVDRGEVIILINTSSGIKSTGATWGVHSPPPATVRTDDDLDVLLESALGAGGEPCR